jgi:hypothetical protein
MGENGEEGRRQCALYVNHSTRLSSSLELWLTRGVNGTGCVEAVTGGPTILTINSSINSG